MERLPIFHELFTFLPSEECFAFALGVQQVIGFGAGKENGLAIGAPGRVALDVKRVIGTFECKELLLHPVIAGNDSLNREEELRVIEILNRHKDRFIFDRTQDVAAIGGDLRKQAIGLLAVLAAVIVPGDNIAGMELHLLLGAGDDIGGFAVGVVNIHRQE